MADKDKNAIVNKTTIGNKRKRQAESRLGNLLSKIRTKHSESVNSIKKKKIHLRWKRFDPTKGVYNIVSHKFGGGYRFSMMEENIKVEKLKEQACNLFFPNGRNSYGELLESCQMMLTDAGDTEINDNMILKEYLDRRGIYVSRTYFVLKTKYEDILSNDVPFPQMCYCSTIGESCVLCNQNNDFWNNFQINDRNFDSDTVSSIPQQKTKISLNSTHTMTLNKFQQEIPMSDTHRMLSVPETQQTTSMSNIPQKTLSNTPQETAMVSTPQETAMVSTPQETYIPNIPKETPMLDTHGQLSVPQTQQTTSLPNIPKKTSSNTPQETPMLSILQETSMVSIPMLDTHRQLSVPETQQTTSLPNVPKKTSSTPQETPMLSVLQETFMVRTHPQTTTNMQEDTPLVLIDDDSSVCSNADTVPFTPAENTVKTKMKTVCIHRLKIKEDMINAFKKINCDDDICYEVIDPRGQREEGIGVGVERDLYTCFWGEVLDSLCIGSTERVPFVRHDLYFEEWEAIGKILCKGFLDAAYFPIQLSQAFLIYVLFGTVPNDQIIDSFFNYLAPMERTIVESALKGIPATIYDEEDFLDVLDRFNCRTRITPLNVYGIILELAQQELIQKPYIMVCSWKKTISILRNHQDFQTIANVKMFYNKVKPTNKKIIKLLQADPQNDGERNAFKYLQQYIRGLDSSNVVKLLHFLTGADIILCKQIEVSFISMEANAARRPIAHTCAPLLEVPNSYRNFCELREEFQGILKSRLMGSRHSVTELLLLLWLLTVFIPVNLFCSHESC